MGHKINPLVFRLGTKNNWHYNLKEKKNWTLSYLIFQLVSNQFFKYTIPYFNREQTRNQRHSTGLVKMLGEKQLHANNFIKRSMLFSHLNLGSQNSNYFINCFFYDYRMTFRNKSPDFTKYNQLFSNVYLKNRSVPYFSKSVTFYSRRLRKWLRLMSQSLWLFNLNVATLKSKLHAQRLFNLIKIWLRLFPRNKRNGVHQNRFFLNVFSYLIIAVIALVSSLGLLSLSNRLYFILVNINLFNFNAKLKNSIFFLKLFRKRYFLFKSLSKSVNQNLKSLLSDNDIKLIISYYAVKERNMTSALLTNLILVKLAQYYRINSILYPLTSWIRRHKNVLGYRIIVSGRLTRRERASHMIKSGKSMPQSSLRHKIDYNQDIKIMKFGMVGIKFYLFLKKKLRNSYYFFKFVC